MCVLVAAIVPAIALGSEAQSAEMSPSEFVDFVKAESPSAEPGPLTDVVAASELPTEDLQRAEAVELTEQVFEPILEDAVGPIQDLEVERYLGDRAAVVRSASQDAAVEVNQIGDQPEADRSGSHDLVLLESSLPLRVEGSDGEKDPVDLSLDRTGDSWQPESPLVEVRIPQDLGDGFSFPGSGINITLQGAPPERAPSIINETAAFYPNVADDADFVAIPTPTGLETLITLRTPSAPHSQVYRVDMPAGATLVQTGAGAEIREGQATTVKILPPTAIDASGADVPVVLEVEGETFAVTTSPQPDTMYPILVDPLLESYDWYATQSQVGQTAWASTGNATGMEASHDNYGLFLRARREWGYKPNDHLIWRYFVPRFKAEEAAGRKLTSFVQRMTLWHLAFVTEPGGSAAPYMYAGIQNEAGAYVGKQGGGTATWVYFGNSPTFYMNAPGNGMLVELENGEPAKRDETAKLGEVGLASHLTTAPAANDRLAAVGAASVEIGDLKNPGASSETSTPWVNQTASEPLAASAEDTGLGVKKIGFSLPFKGVSWVNHSCTGAAVNPCPLKWTASLGTGQYNPGEFPQGLVRVLVTAQDALGNSSLAGDAKALVRVDHTKPTLALSGTITEQGALGTNLPEYKLKYDAADGDNAEATPIVPPIINVGTGSGQMQKPTGVAVDPAGNVWVADRENNRVLKFNKAGVFQLQFGTAGSGNGQFNDPRGIAISPKTGNVWVSELGGNRVQEFKPNGEFVSKITAVGSGTFTDPYGIAVGPDGTVWVADVNGLNTVWMFNEQGTLLGYTHGTAAAPTSSTLELVDPTGVAVDANGNAWVTDSNLNRVTQYSKSDGKWLSQFGSAGANDGQLSYPTGIASGPSGGIFVADSNNNRIQQFKTDGSFTRKFGTAGPGSGQLSEARGLAVDKDGTVLAAEVGNKRVSRWAHGDFNPQSGVVKVEVKVDGQTIPAAGKTETCASTCPLSKEWTLDADDYSVGSHNLKVIATDGVGLATTEERTIETHGDRKDPSIALSGSMTEQASLGTTRPSYALSVNATDPGEANERKSGVASVKVKIDGSEVKSSAPGCPAGGCSLQTEWTLDNLSFSPGSHNVEVIATDAAGRSSSKSVVVNIARDTTAPTVTANNAFYNAPEGWVEQKSYSVTATGQDAAGFGVTSMTLKIDEEVVRSKTQECPSGGCGLMMGFGQPINMAAYEGGAHPAELRVVDGAEKVATKNWTINVSPQGVIPGTEAENTIEALEATDEEAVLLMENEEVIPSVELEAGNDPVLVEGEEGFAVAGVPVETELAPDPEEGFTIPSLEGDVEVEALSAGGGSSQAQKVGQSAVVTPNTGTQVDTVIRPLFTGVTNFSVIRGQQASETFSWRVQLLPGQSLEAVDSHTAQVVLDEDGISEMMIRAETARDATGKAVPTSLQVISANAIQLTVSHRNGGFAYPITAGPSFEVGYSRVRVELPPELLSPELLADKIALETASVSTLKVGAPEVVAASEADGDATISVTRGKRRTFFKSTCGHPYQWYESAAGFQAISNREGRCGNAFRPTEEPGEQVLWRGTMRGAFLYLPGEKVWHKNARDCQKGTPGDDLSEILNFAMKEDSECRYGPKTSDSNGGTSATPGHYLRAQAHWELGLQNRCLWQPPSDCPPPSEYPWEWSDQPLEVHLWPSGLVDQTVGVL